MNETGPARRITLADVAQSAGVSRATASRALNDDPRISPATRRAVRAAAKALRYVPNAAARSLRKHRTRTLGLLLADLGDPVHGQVAAGFELEAASHGYTVIFVSGLDVPANERRALKVFVEHGTDGIALVSSVLDPVEARERAGAERPVVVVQPDHPGILRMRAPLPAGLIRTDDAAGVESAVRHLLASGCRSMLYLGAGNRPSSTIRRDAVKHALEIEGLEPASVIDLADDAWRSPELVGATVGLPLPDAIVCYDDKLALALLDGLRSRGIGVPGDVCVVGFDGIPFAALSSPRLTTVATPSTLIGQLAARMLADAIGSGQLPGAQIQPAELVIRESTLRPGRPAVPARGAECARTVGAGG